MICAVMVALTQNGEAARAVTVPLLFSGPQNSFDGELDVAGAIFANGSGKVVNISKLVESYTFKAPLNHPVALYPGVMPISSQMESNGNSAVVDVKPFGQLEDIVELDLDLLNGQTFDLVFEAAFQTTNSSLALLKTIPLIFSGTLSKLEFGQAAAATISGAGTTGTFSIPGSLTGELDNFYATTLLQLDYPMGLFYFSVPFTLSGTWTSSGPPGNTKLVLNGALNSALPLSLHTNLNTIITEILSLTYNSTIDLMASLLVGGAYHLETTVVIPEPGSIALLVVGLAVLVPALRRQRRGNRPGN
jgi:hypothetical protein